MTTPMPELPHAVYTAFNETTKLYTADQMQAYARAALEAATEQGKRQPKADPTEHLFEFWWAEHMPKATQDKAWAAWQDAPNYHGVGVAASATPPQGKI